MELCFWKHVSFLLLCVLLNFSTLTFSQEFPKYNCAENYTYNGPYQTNLNTLLSDLPSKIDEHGFYNFSFGEIPNEVHAIAMCRGDIEHEACRSCIQNATTKLTKICPNSKEAIGWYENCTLRYSNWSISGSLATEPTACLPNPNDTVSSLETFNQDLRELLDNLCTKATHGGDHWKFSSGNISAPDFSNIYGLVQCIPDLSTDECDRCLNDAIGNIKTCCYGKIGGRVLKPSCNLRYETDYRFFEYTSTDEPPPPSAPPETNDHNHEISRMLVIIGASFMGLLILSTLCIYKFLRKRKHKKPRKRVTTKDRTSDRDDISNASSLQYNFDTISIATNDFHDANKLGSGGFGTVYKGKLPNGLEIAVKRLSQNSRQGEQEFKNEVMLLAKLQHRNLVRLIGFCLEGTERLLIYEFVPNSSLDQFLFGVIKSFADCQRTYVSPRRFKASNYSS